MKLSLDYLLNQLIIEDLAPAVVARVMFVQLLFAVAPNCRYRREQ